MRPKIEQLKDGWKFRAWACREPEGSVWGIVSLGAVAFDEDEQTWEVSGDGVCVQSLFMGCWFGKMWLDRIRPGKRRRVEITVRFV